MDLCPEQEAINNLRHEAREKFFIKPLPPRNECGFDEWIDINSSEWQKECAIQIRRYLSLEMAGGAYRVNMDTSDSGWQNLKVYAFRDYFFDDELKENVEHLVGAVFFEDFSTQGVLLSACWIHPFFRNRGKLKEAIWRFEDKFNCDFKEIKIEFPISAAMNRALKKADHPCVCLP